MNVGLRIDVDTFRGTRLGVPNLCKLLASHDVRATFFFSVGPDNMGRHLRRLIYPSFFLKMLRSNAPGLYGWDIVFMGTLWDGPVIGEKLAPMIRKAVSDGHEIGLHAWDHHFWQSRIDKMDRGEIRSELRKGFDMMTKIVGSPPACSAVAGWKCNELTIEEKEKFAFRYNSDCRGVSIFRPSIRGESGDSASSPGHLADLRRIGRSPWRQRRKLQRISSFPDSAEEFERIDDSRRGRGNRAPVLVRKVFAACSLERGWIRPLGIFAGRRAENRRRPHRYKGNPGQAGMGRLPGGAART